MRLIIPMTLQNFMFALIPVSDAVMLVVLDQDSMSAVSLASQVMFVFNMFVYAILSGMNMFAAQYWGSRDKDSMEKVQAYVMNLMIPISFFFFAITFILPEGVMRIFTDEPAIIAYGIGYLRMVSFAYIFDGVAQVFSTMLKNTELVKQSTIIGVGMVFLNIGLNAVFIYGLCGAPAMGANGAALATTVSCLAGCIAAVEVFVLKCPVKMRFSYFASPLKDFRKQFSKYTTPMVTNQLLWGIAFTLTSVIIGHMGRDAVAANAIAAVAKDLVSCFCYALGAGGGIVVGNELGAGNLALAKEYGIKITKLSVVSGLLLGIFLASLTPVIVHFTNLTPTASRYLTGMLLMCSYYIMGRSINSTVIGGIFPAGGDTVFGMICDTVTMWFFILPVASIAAFVLKWPVMVVFFLINLDEMIKLPVVFHHFRKYKWVKNIVS